MTVALSPCAGDGAAGHEHAAAGGLALRGGAGAAVGLLASSRPRLRLLASGQRQPRAARVSAHDTPLNASPVYKCMLKVVRLECTQGLPSYLAGYQGEAVHMEKLVFMCTGAEQAPLGSAWQGMSVLAGCQDERHYRHCPREL